MPIRAVLFDLGDTLFRLDPIGPSVQDELVRLLRERTSLPHEDTEKFAASLSDRVRTYANGLGDGSELAEIDIAREATELLARAGSPGDPAIGEAVSDLFSHADIARFRPLEDCASRVEAFRRSGLRLALVSNTSSSPALLSAYLNRIGLGGLFDAVVFSVELGWRKPDPKTYLAALDALDITPGEALFVGDRLLQDVIGPQAVGMRAVLTHEFRQEAVGHARPLAVIQRLDDLHNVIAQTRG
jgi:FMN phosphatase YigB (HAD superfamily)